MTQTQERTIEVLNDLVHICQDGEKGLEEAAGHLKDPKLKAAFGELSGERGRFSSELEAHILALGADPSRHGTVTGAAHRTWVDLKAALGGGDHTILASAECAEDMALKEYKRALESEDLAPDSRALVQRQIAHVQVAHDRVKGLRDSCKA